MNWNCPHCRQLILAKATVDGPSQRPADRMLSMREVAAVTGLSPSTIWRRIKDGTFPPGWLISSRRRGWPQSVIEAWAASRAVNHCAGVPRKE